MAKNASIRQAIVAHRQLTAASAAVRVAEDRVTAAWGIATMLNAMGVAGTKSSFTTAAAAAGNLAAVARTLAVCADTLAVECGGAGMDLPDTPSDTRTMDLTGRAALREATLAALSGQVRDSGVDWTLNRAGSAPPECGGTGK